MVRRRSRVFALATLAIALATTPPRTAAANGGNSHAWITFHAVEHLPDGELKRLLTQPAMQSILLNGSVFPDGGYVVDNDYGEMSHWEPFVTAYIEWMLRTQPRPFTDGHSAEYVAFLMGLASHGMADQVFDATFMDSARIYDAAGWSEELFDSFDTATDVLLVAETGVSYLEHMPWVPAAEISALFQDAFGYTISAADLYSAQDLLYRLVLTFAVTQAADAGIVADYEARYAWAAAHLMDPSYVGAPPCEGEVVAAYMLALWDRLHEASGPANWVIATYPRDGAAGHPTDDTLVESQVVIVSGHGIYRDELAAHTTVTDWTGRSYPLQVTTQWGAAEANLIRIRPLEAWAANETFTVTLSPGLTTLDGFTYDEPFTMTFSTLPATEPVDPTSDPTPHEGEPDVRRLPASGCNVSAGVSGRPAGALGALLALALLVARAAGRARPRRS